MRDVFVGSVLAATLSGCSCDGTQITADAGPERDAAPALDASTLVLDTGERLDAPLAMGDDSGSDAGSCCDRLGTTSEIAWRASDGVVPDVACPPWTLSDSAPTDATLSAGVLRIETASDGESISYGHEMDDIQAGATVVLEARLRVVSGSSSTTSRAPALIAAVFGTARAKAMLQIESGAIFLNSDENVRGPEAALDATVMHTYRIEIDLGTGAVAVLVDGTPTLTGSTFTEPTAVTDYVFFGEGSSFAHGVSEWESFQHDAYGGCDRGT